MSFDAASSTHLCSVGSALAKPHIQPDGTCSLKARCSSYSGPGGNGGNGGTVNQYQRIDQSGSANLGAKTETCIPDCPTLRGVMCRVWTTGSARLRCHGDTQLLLIRRVPLMAAMVAVAAVEARLPLPVSSARIVTHLMHPSTGKSSAQQLAMTLAASLHKDLSYHLLVIVQCTFGNAALIDGVKKEVALYVDICTCHRFDINVSPSMYIA